VAKSDSSQRYFSYFVFVFSLVERKKENRQNGKYHAAAGYKYLCAAPRPFFEVIDNI
jgi:hypothetical protein